MTAAWVSVGPGVVTSVDTLVPHSEAPGSNRFEVAPGSSGSRAEFVPAAPVDLSAYDEIRLWVKANVRADGSQGRPFLLQFEYLDAADLPGEEHRWLIPVNRPEQWEQRRFGIEADRRSQITAFRISAVTDRPVSVLVGELLAARPDMVTDVEAALEQRLAAVRIPSLADIPLFAAATAGDLQVDLVNAPDIEVGNMMRFEGGDAGPEERQIIAVAHGVGQTTVSFTDPLAGNYLAGSSSASVVVPVLFERPPASTTPLTPVLIASSHDVQEDLRQCLQYQQRDSFRMVNGIVQASIRRAPRVYQLDYQLIIVASGRQQHRQIHVELARYLSRDRPLRIAGALAPVQILAPPELPKDRSFGLPAPVYLRVYTTLEVEPRSTRATVDDLGVAGAPFDAANTLSDFEQIRIRR